jgi:MFS family permease
LQRLAANLGFSFGPAIGGLLSKFSYLLLFLVDGLSTLLAGALVFYFFRLRRLAPATEVALPDATTPAGSPLRDGAFTAFLGLSLLFMMVFMQFSSTYPLYLRDHFGLDEPGIGLMYAVNTSIIVACEMLLIDAVKHWRLMPTIACGSCLACVGFGMLPLGETWRFAALAMAVVTIGEMLSFPLSSSFVANRSAPGREGAYQGWYMVTHALAWVLGPGIGAAIYQRDRDAVWWVAVAIAAAIFAGFQLLARRTGLQPCGAVEAPAAPLPPAELPLDQLPQHAS